MTTVFPSKYVAETVTVRWNFADELAFGETIASSVVTVEVFTGVDSSPSSFLSGATTNSGTVVAQHLIRGLPGVVYTLICDVVGSSGATYQKVSRQAVINNFGGIFPAFNELDLVGDLPDGFLGVPYFATLQIVGGVPPYSNLQVISGSMPGWLSGNIVGAQVVYTGLPNALGTSNFNPQIDDFAGQRADEPQQLQVQDAIIVTGHIVAGVSGDPLSYQYTISGGTPPYTTTISSGLLPTGNNANINNTALVTGTYSSVGTYNWTLRVQDSLGLVGFHPDTCVVGQLLWFLSSINSVGNNGYILSDGVTWMGTIQNITTNTWIGSKCVAATADEFLVTSTNATFLSPDEGVTWIPDVPGQNLGTTATLIYVNGVYLAAKTSGYVSRSLDGINWTNAVGGGLATVGIASNGTLTLATNYFCTRSFDLGVSWSMVPGTIIDASNQLNSIATDGSIFIAVGSNNNMRWTTDGITWNVITSPYAGINQIDYIVWDRGRWVMVNRLGSVAYSSLGTSAWTISSSLGGPPSWLYARSGRYLVCGAGGLIMTSGTNMVWTYPTTSFGTRHLFCASALIVN